MSKDQKQKLVLALLAVLVGGAILRSAVLQPMQKKKDDAAKIIQELRTKVMAAENLLPTAATTLNTIQRRGQDLNEVTEQHLPIPGNEFAWAAGIVYNIGRQQGHEVNIEDIGRTIRDARAAPLAHPSNLQAYSVKVDTQCGYNDLVGLIEALVQTGPFLTVSRVSIIPTDQPAVHEVTLFLQWPVWDDLQFLKRLASAARKDP